MGNMGWVGFANERTMNKTMNTKTNARRKLERKGTYIKAPPYLGDPKFANAMSKPPGYLALAVGGNVIWKRKKIAGMCVE